LHPHYDQSVDHRQSTSRHCVVEAPFFVRVVARKHNLPIPLALVMCELAGIDGGNR